MVLIRKEVGYRFVVDKSGEVTLLGLALIFNKVNKLVDGANPAVDDHNGIVNGSHSFIQKLDVKMNGREVYDCNNADQVVIEYTMILCWLIFNNS